MSNIIAVYQACIGWMPVYLQVLIVGFVVFMAAWLIVKLLSRIMEAIPFI